jgi:hypothetical protein
MTRTSFKTDFKERAVVALRVMNNVGNIEMTQKTAITLSKDEDHPNFHIENEKVEYLKKLLCVSKFTPPR